MANDAYILIRTYFWSEFLIPKALTQKNIYPGLFFLLMSRLAISDPVGNHTDECTPDCDNPEHNTWIDKSRVAIDNQVDSLAMWLDDFFGTPSEDIESANTALRLQFKNTWLEGEGNDANLRLRGKIRLPQIGKRISLVFLDDDDPDTDSDISKEVIDRESDDTNVALQYVAEKKERTHADLKLSLRSGFHPKITARYRYTFPFSEEFEAKFIQTVFYRTDEGFGASTRARLDWKISDNKLLSWSNQVKVAEEFDGERWSSTLSLARRLEDDRALAFAIGASGQTEPDYLTTDYGFSVVYRQRIFRPWLFIELEPGYRWQKGEDDDHREGRAIFTLRFEAKFDATPKSE